MNRMSCIISVLRQQLAAQGYHLTDEELRDNAAQLVMALDELAAEPPRAASNWRPTDGAVF